ncbi:gag-pol polyprotein [Tanacetum coccineum]
MPVLRLDLQCLKDVAIYHRQVDEGPYEFRIFTPSETEAPMETRFNNEFDQFVAEPGEALVSVYNRFVQLMNDLERNDIMFQNVTVNTKFLNCLQPEWLKAKKVEKSHDPLALVAHTGSSSRTITPYYVTHPPSVVDYDDDYQGDVVQNNYEDPLTSAMNLLARAITERFSNPTNNRLRTSSNTRNQAIVQGDRRTLRTTSSGTAANVQCYNCCEKGHYASNCTKPRVQDSKYFMEQMLLAKQDEAGVILTDEHNNFLFVDASQMEEIKELNVNSGTVEYDNKVHESYALEQLARNAYKEAEKQQKFSQKVQQQNKVLTKQLESYKEKVQSILKRRMSENEDKYHETVIDIEARAKNNEDVVLKMGNSLHGIFMIGPKPMSFYDLKVKHGLGYTNPYTLKKAISQNPILYDASCLDDSKIQMNVRDTRDILDDTSKS